MSADQELGEPRRRGHLQSSGEGRFTDTDPPRPSPSHNKQCSFASQGLSKLQRDRKAPGAKGLVQTGRKPLLPIPLGLVLEKWELWGEVGRGEAAPRAQGGSYTKE